MNSNDVIGQNNREEVIIIFTDEKTKKPHRRLCDIEKDMMNGSVVSSTECTGLTATIPEDESEVESYREIYDIPLSADPHRKKKRKNNE